MQIERSFAIRRLRRARSATTGRLGRGQSLVEFALLLPVLLLILLGGLDLGRVFLGWVSLNNTARVAASYAASNALLIDAGNSAALASYNTLVQNDTAATNCTPPDPVPAPAYTPSATLGSHATVEISCSFQILTPVISQVLGGSVTVSAASTFPIRIGIVANVPGGGGGGGPVAAFTASPTTGDAPLAVTFTNTTTGTVATWAWDFGNGETSTAQDPPPVTYTAAGTFTVTLTASDGLNSSTASRTVDVTLPPGPLAAFTVTPSSGTAPLSVAFANTSTGTNLTYAWDFGDGTTSTEEDPPSKSYPAGSWTVTLVVTDDAALTSTATQTVTVTAPIPQCQVPNFKNDTTSNATITKWTTAGFTAANILFSPSRPPEYKISKQSLAAGSTHPCATTSITVYDH
jgi:PKD repeat protein